MQKQIEIYQSTDGQTQIEVRFGEETVWLSQRQMAELFDKDADTIGLHLKNIFAEGELEEHATTEESSVVQQEGRRNVRRKIRFYNLDAVLSVGYRVNSKRGTQFRQWATQRLKDFLIQGYAVNEKRLAQKQKEVQILKDGIRILSRAIETNIGPTDLSWLRQFAKGLELLDDYDHEQLDDQGINVRQAIYPDLADYRNTIAMMRTDFHSTIFGKEKDDSFQSSIAQISKGFGDVDFYPSIEEKAATLLYLVVKNHSFVDGNKRIAAACFLLFLEVNNLLKSTDEIPLISNEALASLTLFIAVSNPWEIETVKRLVVSVLNRNQ